MKFNLRKKNDKKILAKQLYPKSCWFCDIFIYKNLLPYILMVRKKQQRARKPY